MAPDIFPGLVLFELSILPVTCTQMIAYTESVSRQCYLRCKNVVVIIVTLIGCRGSLIMTPKAVYYDTLV